MRNPQLPCQTWYGGSEQGRCGRAPPVRSAAGAGSGTGGSLLAEAEQGTLFLVLGEGVSYPAAGALRVRVLGVALAAPAPKKAGRG